MASKLLNGFEKILFILALVSLASNFSFITVPFTHKPFINNAIHFLTNIPSKDIGSVVRTWSDIFDARLLDAAFLFALLMCLIRPGLLAKFSKTLWRTGLLMLLLFACASWFWSIAPGNTLAGLYLVIKMTTVGIYLSQRYSAEENLELLVLVLALVSVFSILAIWQVPGQATHPGGEWRGIFIGKNFLGRMMAFGNIILIVYWLKNNILWKRIFALALFVLCSTLLFFSASTTSLLVALAVYLGFIVYGVWKKWIAHLNIKWLLVISGIVAVVLAFWKINAILALFNKTSTLTGRTALWEILWGWFQTKPLFGFGYEAFWSQFPDGIKPSGPGWADGAARHAHNGYFDVALALGAFGLLLFLFILALSWKNGFTFLRQKKQVIWLWPLLALFYLTFSNITYSIAFALPDFHWALFVLASGLVASSQHETLLTDSSLKKIPT